MAESSIVVHHLNNSRSQRILWLLEELGVPYTIKKYQRGPDMLAPPELKAIHPLGMSPVVTDGDLVLGESGAIVEYLIKKYGNGKFVPSESGYIDNLYYTHYTEGTLAPLLVNRIIFKVIPDRWPLLIRPMVRIVFDALLTNMVDPRLKTNAEMIEAHLSKNPGAYFAGGSEPTSADFMMAFSLEAVVARVPADIVGDQIRSFVERVHERPAYKRGLEKGGKFELAK